jgi:hypothetical protein
MRIETGGVKKLSFEANRKEVYQSFGYGFNITDHFGSVLISLTILILC